MTTSVLKTVLNNIKPFVSEGGDHRKVVEHQDLTRQRSSITRIRNIFRTSSTAAALRLRPPAVTIDSVHNSAPAQGRHAKDEDLPTAPQQQQDSVNS